MVSFSSTIAVDLSRRSTLQALASLKGMHHRGRKVNTANIYLSKPSLGIHDSLSPHDIVQVFGILGELPNLKRVHLNLSRSPTEIRCRTSSGTADAWQWCSKAAASITSISQGVSFSISIPLEALITLLASKCCLKELYLQNVRLLTKDATLSSTAQTLEQAAEQQARLREVTLVDCAGGEYLISTLATHCHGLRQLKVRGTSVGSTFQTTEVMQSLRRRLHNLVLEDVRDMSDSSLMSLAGPSFLSHPKCRLKDLVLKSSTVRDQARVGNSLANMLAYNGALENVTLHVDCERIGVALARHWSANYHMTSKLKSLDLRCYGDDENILDDAVHIAHALSHEAIDWAGNKVDLQHLHLSLEMEPSLLPGFDLVDCNERGSGTTNQTAVMTAFGNMMQSNGSLQSLILDDGTNQRYELTPEIHLNLKLNQCGYPCKPTTSPNRAACKNDQLLDSLIAGKESTDVSFFILSRHPDIIVNACLPECLPNNKTERKTCRGRGIISTGAKKRLTYTGSGITTSKVSFRQRVLSILAPSAA